ncbi:hypothetical protein Tco_1338165 [Tanacetum coccineum]
MRLITMSSFDIIKMKSRRSWEDHRLEEVVKSSREERNVGKSNIGDSDNTRDGGKIVGGAIRACERASEAKRSLVKSSKKLEEVFPGEAGKTGSLYPKTYWELLPKEYWELLPKEILGAITQRETGMSYGKMEGLEVGSIRRIQGLDTTYWGFLGVGTTFDIFQNIHILYLEYGVLSLSGYGVLSFITLWSLVSSDTDTPYLP